MALYYFFVFGAIFVVYYPIPIVNPHTVPNLNTYMQPKRNGVEAGSCSTLTFIVCFFFFFYKIAPNYIPLGKLNDRDSRDERAFIFDEAISITT